MRDFITFSQMLNSVVGKLTDVALPSGSALSRIKAQCSYMRLFQKYYNDNAPDQTFAVNTALDENVYIYKNVVIDNGVSLSVNTGSGLVLVCKSITVNGLITATGKGATGGNQGAAGNGGLFGGGGGGGGNGNEASARAGGGGGAGGNGSSFTGGAGLPLSGTLVATTRLKGGDAASSGANNPGVSATNYTPLITELVNESAIYKYNLGGGGGGGAALRTGTSGRTGGAGGGYLIIVAQSIIVNATGAIRADGLNGANGTEGSGNYSGGGGGGGGGVIVLSADVITNSGAVTSNGGTGGLGYLGTGAGGNGANGFVLINEY